MENLDSNSTMCCSTHSDKVAKAACISTKELLCFECLLEKAKASVPVKELEEMSEGVEKLILDCLKEKQRAQRKNNYIDEYKKKTEDAKEKLSKEIHCFYEQLTEKIVKMKDNTLLSLEAKNTLLLEMCNKDEEKLKTATRMINTHLDKLSEAKGTDFDKFKAEVEKIMNKLDDIVDHESCPEAVFHASKQLNEVIHMSESMIGEVIFFASDHYEALGPTITESKENPEGTILEDPTSVVQPKLGSDEVIEEIKPIVIPRERIPSKEPDSPESIQVPEENGKSKGKQKNPIKKQEKKRIKLFKRSSKQDIQEDDLQVYEEFNFKNENSEQEARHLVNRTVTLSEFPDDLSTSFKFTKLVPIGLRRIGLLSENHSSIFLCGLDGKIQCTKTYPKDALISIVEMADDMIAVLNNKATTIETLKVIDKRFEVKNTINLKLDISKVTGFDYLKKNPTWLLGPKWNMSFLIKRERKSNL
ncbi:uncharacterized protein LOC132745576 [Ruditapes philippinarum]|uniref:uncharacterized protein LOC132745576 n=1 Tax=Ruditapes philippinarum TaxID=129788 RepID=UPI00295B1A4D|nr:uncharacterized protein LOC132745576 [Ruditapes philippinarum]